MRTSNEVENDIEFAVLGKAAYALRLETKMTAPHSARMLAQVEADQAAQRLAALFCELSLTHRHPGVDFKAPE